MWEIQNSEKTACQKVVAMVTSNLIDKDLLHQIVPKGHQVWWP